VGAQAALVLESISMGVVSGVLTLLILIFSELIPKTLGASYWKSLAFFTTKSLQVLTILMYPLVLVAQGITKILKTKNEPSVERSEIVALADLGLREGVFTNQEARILKNLIGLRQLSVRDVMTPRMVMVAASEDMTVGEFNRSDQFYRFSRIPLFKGSKDHITGFVHKHDVLAKQAEGEENLPLSSIKREIAVVPDTQSLFTLYSFLTKENAHIALVVEEYGGTAGLATMEDVLETLLGLEIMDEFDYVEDMQQYARSRWEERAERLGIRTNGDREPPAQPGSRED
jgi:CBS domain containing-hemolysin-like protein